ncbi:hypothetical protein [Absidia glauca]|uniref:DH domain-containing protein n=1 Tax=Absidia glauca TaxID=4829 RepID=A0A163J2D9_ABSGL|nr:hypothetical protein [Absidia glauca]
MDDMNVYTDDPIMQSPTTIISDSVKKSYEQQLLPIRQQSLPCHQNTVLPGADRLVNQTSKTKNLSKASVKQIRNKPGGGEKQVSETPLFGGCGEKEEPGTAGSVTELLDSTQDAPQRLWHGSEIVDQLLTLLHTTYRQVAINVASALPLVQINGPPLDSISDSTDLLYRLPIQQPSRSQQQQRTPSSLFTELYQGVFVPLSKCYAPRCTRDQTCYSVSCPNKFVSPAKVPLPSSSKAKATATHHQPALWIHSVPRTVVSGTPPSERYRQEAIYELIQTEIDFVGHLRYIKKFWIDPLDAKHGSIAQQIFWNWQDVMQVSTCLMEALVTRQQEDHRITHVGDVLLAHVGQFEPFVIYGSHQLLAK